MNPVLQVKFRFSNESNSSRPGSRNLRTGAEVTVEKIDALMKDIRSVRRFYQGVTQPIIRDMLVDIRYNDIIAKSQRVQRLFQPAGGATNDIVVGARFSDDPEGKETHIITYYVNEETVERTLTELDIAKRFLSEQLGGRATPENFNETRDRRPALDYTGFPLGKTALRNLVADCAVTLGCSFPHISEAPDRDDFLITFYRTELGLSDLLEKLEIDSRRFPYTFYGEDTISATRELYEILSERASYLISMISSDFAKISPDEVEAARELPAIEIPPPANEPVIGVIDTLFDENVYFSEWVDNTDYLNELEGVSTLADTREHGTEVSSILVDGPRMNPWLDDGCGRFRVKHFGVCVQKISVPRLVNKIKEIVNNNPEIHVWNLSLGTEEEISKNFISYDAAVLDELQAQKNVLFVVAGTNDEREVRTSTLKVGSPADSLNAVVVNSVRRDGTPTSYSRRGNVLSFFNKPDVSYYGGDYDERITAYSPTVGDKKVYGTSMASPWISRKLCYLIEVMGFPKEVAKALLIDSAAGWDYKRTTYRSKDLLGYGIVPIEIGKVLSSESDEIRFFVYGASESYRTANYGVPVPKDADDKYPYVARAAMCYFPPCSRVQGVDYTNRELSLKFGRIKKDGSIEDINDNLQGEEGAYIDERQSRKEFRKWENTKFISRVLRSNRPLKSYEERQWGLSVTSMERLSTGVRQRLNFGIVITLREINGVNRIQDFVRACQLRGWIVDEIDVENRLEIYNAGQEEIEFD